MMKKVLFALIVILSLILTFTACTPTEPVCQHRDADDDSLCDECDESYTNSRSLAAPAVFHYKSQ